MSTIKNTCEHILLRGDNKGKKCPFTTKTDSSFCYRHHKQHKQQENCPICMEEIKNTNCCTLECGHKYHLPCIFQLYKQNAEFNNKCPLCRKEFTEKSRNHTDVHYVFMRRISPDEETDDEPEQAQQLPRLIDLPPPAPLRRQRAMPIDADDDNIHPFQFLINNIPGLLSIVDEMSIVDENEG